jgi:hypothetical protein
MGVGSKVHNFAEFTWSHIMKREFLLLDNFKEIFPTILGNPCWFEVAMKGGNANCNYQISHLFIKTPQTGLAESSASSADIWPYLHYPSWKV